MDRKIPYGRRVSFRAVAGMLAIAASATVLTSQIAAQERGFGRRGGGGFQPPSPEEMFTRTDTNNDGTLSASEVNNSFMSRFLRDVDTSNGLSREQFIEEMQKMRERFGRGGRDRGDSDRRRDRGDGDGERRERSGDAPAEGTAQPANGTTTPAPATGAAPASTPTPRARVTLDLQADLSSTDTDRDGQIGLYEWRRSAGRSLSEFRQLDLNGDGFITPREYATVRPAPEPVAVTAPTAAATPAATTATPAAQTPMSDPAAATPAPSGSTAPSNTAAPATMPADSPATRDAVRFFGLLDTNGDGQIAPSEWVDGRIRELFTKNSIDMSQPLKLADFASHYVRLSATP